MLESEIVTVKVTQWCSTRDSGLILIAGAVCVKLPCSCCDCEGFLQVFAHIPKTAGLSVNCPCKLALVCREWMQKWDKVAVV